MNDLREALFGNRCEADDETVERPAELEIFFLRTLHVHHADRVVLRLQVLVSLENLWIGSLVQRVDESQVHRLVVLCFD